MTFLVGSDYRRQPKILMVRSDPYDRHVKLYIVTGRLGLTLFYMSYDMQQVDGLSNRKR